MATVEQYSGDDLMSYSRPFLDVAVGEFVCDDISRLKRKVVGIQWVNGTVRPNGNNHFGSWGVYLENETGGIEAREAWEISTLMTEEEQIAELPNCSCSPDDCTVITKFCWCVKAGVYSNEHPDFPRIEEVAGNHKLNWIECTKCGKTTGRHEMFDLVRTQWIKMAGV